MIIYHVTTRPEWEAAKQQGRYVAPSLQTEGFIHCSTEHQVAGVLQRYFANVPDRVKLTLDTDKLTSKLQFDLAPSVGEEFPHIYGPINMDAVVGVEEVDG